ncbi:MAG: type III-B CRISPR module RAMP protein Cmr6 [Thiotrichaceae bacterium]|nr:type III-B CRISPR module RAMP protein Cmr6 [Thiotrichaceae bacterium]PCI13443.1 MAG: type III-B CRISPR module RAMP protein Cmr6 [Thiotrichales bacterium]
MPQIPLYDDCSAKKQLDSHSGLWFNKFFDKYEPNWKPIEGEGGKSSWLKQFNHEHGGKQVTEYAARQRVLVSLLGGDTLAMKTQWHFVTGMGNNHPVENGFAWHPTLGVPYLTGAAVKGLLRAWCEEWDKKDDATLALWFGSKNDKSPSAGALIFFDAVPINPVTLKVDVMTPHYGKWYEKGDQKPEEDGSNIPADWHSPVPIPFLVVDKNQSFQFSISKRETCAAQKIELSVVMKELESALECIGAGAKTAAGYGQMRSEKSIHKQKEQENEIKAKGIEDRAFSWLSETLKDLREDKDLSALPETDLWKKSLATRWQLAPKELKPILLEEIKKKWIKLGIKWGAPEGGSARNAKNIYSRG